MKNTELILILMFSYCVMLLTITRISKLKPGITLHDKLYPNNFRTLNYVHAIGITVMLLIPFMTMPLPLFLLLFPDKINIGQAIAFLTCFGVIGLFPWTKMYHVDQKTDNIIIPAPAIFLYGSLRLLFLISYEWFFRALLLTDLSLWVGTGYGIVINVLLYALIHIHKSKKEIIACLPFGLLMCVFTVWWQSVWPAIIFHLQIAIVNEWRPFQKIISPQKQAAL